jgi:hypothetical protein
MKVERLVREFSYNGVRLPDPNPKLTVDEVRSPPIPGYRYGAHHWAGSCRRQAALPVHASHRLEGVTR